ncbi:MAG: SDR family NAD(P)-dependent oxidoreductase [Bacteroidota bacterium]|jgi:3-oxoacyl-[acyl-carrier protein] reductase
MSTNHYLIVGGTSGIGASLVSGLHSSGHKVTSISRFSQPYEAIEGVNYLQCDINDDQAALPIISEPIDGLVYCPGSITLKPFRSLRQDDFKTDFQINLLGAVRCIQAYLPKLQESQRPSIVLFSTVAVQTGMSFHASVAAAKGAVEGFARALASEFAPKVRVNVIAPSLTATPMAEKLTNSEAKLKASEEKHPMKRIGKPEEIASMAKYLLGNESTWITGQVFHIDGGMSSLK